MIKDLVVNLALGEDRDVAAEYAVSIASTFEAHVAGLAFAYDPVITPTVMDGLSASWVEAQRGENRGAAEAAINRFEELVRRNNLSGGHRLMDASIGSAAGLFGRIARRFDLSVVAQPEEGETAPGSLFIEAALFESGRPVVVVPYIQKQGLSLNRVLIAWNSSRNAARAIADAMPFLARSKAVELVIVANRAGEPDEIPGVDFGEHLARHGLKVEVKRLVAPDVDVTNTILSYAADCSADFLVMGGYGHSRLREFVLGGATAGIISSMTVPVLMAH